MFKVFLGLIAASAIFLVGANKPEPAKPEAMPTKTVVGDHLDTIVLGSGCFWGAEKRYEAITGVVDAVSGYADGDGVSPTYKEITRWKHRFNPKNHAEVVQVTFDPQVVSLDDIIKVYFESHDPTQVNRQGNDVGTQYRSTILTNDAQQSEIANALRDEFQERLSAEGYGKIATIIKPLSEFFPAEEYHQDYLKKNPKGYCPDHSTGVTFLHESSKDNVVDNSTLLSGQQIVVVEADFCPYCEQFKKDVVSGYKKATPITFRKGHELDGLKVTTATWATPTILFLEDGKEVAGHQGYMSADQFYQQHQRLAFQ